MKTSVTQTTRDLFISQLCCIRVEAATTVEGPDHRVVWSSHHFECPACQQLMTSPGLQAFCRHIAGRKKCLAAVPKDTLAQLRGWLSHSPPPPGFAEWEDQLSGAARLEARLKQGPLAVEPASAAPCASAAAAAPSSSASAAEPLLMPVGGFSCSGPGWWLWWPQWLG